MNYFYIILGQVIDDEINFFNSFYILIKKINKITILGIILSQNII